MPISERSAMPMSDIVQLISSVKWYHSVEILPGVVAPGKLPLGSPYDPHPSINFATSGTDFAGKRILEIGTWDGPIAYTLKSMGYDVVACDIQNPNLTGFNVVGKITGLEVPYVRCSVYELNRFFEEEFDIVLFYGVFYHLKHPLLAFERISEVLKPGGMVFVLGSGLGNYFESLGGDVIDSAKAEEFGVTLSRMDELGIPLCLSYPGSMLKGDNWFMPNISAIVGWMNSAGFDVTSKYASKSPVGTLNIGVQGCRVGVKAIEHGLVGEEGGFKAKFSW